MDRCEDKQESEAKWWHWEVGEICLECLSLLFPLRDQALSPTLRLVLGAFPKFPKGEEFDNIIILNCLLHITVVTAPSICILKLLIIDKMVSRSSLEVTFFFSRKGFLSNIKQVEKFFIAREFSLVSKLTLHNVKGWLSPNVNNCNFALDTLGDGKLLQKEHPGPFLPALPLYTPIPLLKRIPNIGKHLWITKIFFVYVISFNPYKSLMR